MEVFKVILHNGLEFPYTVKEGQDTNTKVFPTFDSAWNASKLFANAAEDFTIVRYKVNAQELVNFVDSSDIPRKGEELNRIIFRHQIELTPTQADRVRKLKILFDNVNQRRRDKNIQTYYSVR